MPIYEYICPECGIEEEFLEDLSDEPYIHYCVCDGAMRRVISSGSFVLPGTGWYKPSPINRGN